MLLSKRTQRVLALDLSLNSTGYAYEQSGTYATGTIKPKNLRGAARLQYNRDALTAVFEEANPRAVVIEGYSMGSKGNVFNIGEWGGVAKVVAVDQGVKSLMLVAPSVLKKLVTGKGKLPSGKAGKEIMVSVINGWMGTDLTSNDEADALSLLCIGNIYYNRKGPAQIVARLSSQLDKPKDVGIEVEVF